MVRVEGGITRVWVDDGFLCGVGSRVGVMGLGESAVGVGTYYAGAGNLWGRSRVLALDDGMGWGKITRVSACAEVVHKVTTKVSSICWPSIPAYNERESIF